MFYCRVLAGDSQKCPKLSGEYRDTDFKDTVNKIRYESMTEFLNGSNVFVVYKNRRAYPSYLIKYTKKWDKHLKKHKVVIILLDKFDIIYCINALN